MDTDQIRKIIEAALLAAGRPLDVGALEKLFLEAECPDRDVIRAVLEDIESDCRDRGYELRRTASGYRFQVRQELAQWIGRLWDEKPKKYSRALLETLALIAYRQPATRGDIEQVRGVGVGSEIIRTLLEREWIRPVGHRDVPGRPTLYATSKKFLDDFNLKSLDELPPLSEIRDLELVHQSLELEVPGLDEPETTETISEPNPDTASVDAERGEQSIAPIPVAPDAVEADTDINGEEVSNAPADGAVTEQIVDNSNVTPITRS